MTKHNTRFISTVLLSSQILLCIICLVHLLAFVTYLLQTELSVYLFPAAIVIAVGVHFLFAKKLNIDRTSLLIAVGCSLFVLAVSLWLAWFYFDLSWDGQAYHQAAVYDLAGQWNPIFQSLHTPDCVDDRSILNFPKNSWLFGAALLRLFGNVEVGKAYNFIVLFAAFGVVYALCCSYKMRVWKAVLLTVLVLLNPVVWSEICGYLNDGSLYLFFVIYLGAFILWLRDWNPISMLLGAMAAVCLINVKFTGLVFFVITLLCMLVYMFFRERNRIRTFLTSNLLTGIIALFVFGFNPYVTNTINRGNPLYPVMGSKAFPKASDTNEKFETPKNMKGKSLLTRLFYAHFSKPGNAPYNKEKNAELANPFTTSPATWQAYEFQETRVSGFGPYFGILLLLTLLGLPVILISIKAFRLPALLFLVGLCSCLTLSKHFWWPRFFPLFWLAPILPLFLLWIIDEKHILLNNTSNWAKARKIYSVVLAAIIGINGLIVACIHIHWETVSSITLRTQLEQISTAQQPIEVDYGKFKRSIEEKLNHRNIKFTAVSLKDSSIPSQQLMSVVKGYPNQVLYRQRLDGKDSNRIHQIFVPRSYLKFN